MPLHSSCFLWHVRCFYFYSTQIYIANESICMKFCVVDSQGMFMHVALIAECHFAVGAFMGLHFVVDHADVGFKVAIQMTFVAALIAVKCL